MLDITVLISTSPRPSHPSTRIIDQTIISVRDQLPDAPIVIMCDGAGDIPRDRMAAYSGFKQTLEGRWDRCEVITFDQPVHQSGMAERALERVETPLVLYLEDDWRLLSPIEWPELSQIILSGEVNQIKFHAAPRIHPVHEPHMVKRVVYGDVHLVFTTQWSQNPHLASTEFYRRIERKYLHGRVDYIENCMAAPCATFKWEEFKLAIYNPCSGDMMRIYHLDGDRP